MITKLKENCFDLLTVSPNLYYKKCMEISQENLPVDIGAERVKYDCAQSKLCVVASTTRHYRIILYFGVP